MSSNPKRIISIEEHFWIPSLRDRYTGYAKAAPHHPIKELDDLGEIRLRAMDDAGVDYQVISHMQPGTQMLDSQSAVQLAREANDTLYRAIEQYPTRFGGFAELPTPDPEAAADELERTVVQYGFKGALINGLTNGVFLDDPRFWYIFERAEALDVPIYLHPAVPHEAVVNAYYEDHKINGFPVGIVLWGFVSEVATQVIRLIQSGVFNKYPKLKFVIGRLGEALPFMLWRCDSIYSGIFKTNDFSTIFKDHFYVTTSGNFSNSALTCAMSELGSDKIMFAVDWPFNSNESGVSFVKNAAITAEQRDKIFYKNAQELLKIS